MPVITKEQAEQKNREQEARQLEQRVKKFENKLELANAKNKFPIPTLQEAEAIYEETIKRLQSQIEKKEISFQDYQAKLALASEILNLTTKNESLTNIKASVLISALQKTHTFIEYKDKPRMKAEFARLLQKNFKNEFGLPHKSLANSISGTPKPYNSPENFNEIVKKIESLCSSLIQ